MDPRIKKQREEAATTSAKIQGAARFIAGLLTEVAHGMEQARASAGPKGAAAVERGMNALDDLHVALDALDDAEGTLAIALRYGQIRDDLTLTPADRGRLDVTVDRMISAGVATYTHAQAMIEAVAKAVPERDGLRAEIERDRAVLKAHRTDLGITARLGGAAGGARSSR
jgi:hypothetical protein